MSATRDQPSAAGLLPQFILVATPHSVQYLSLLLREMWLPGRSRREHLYAWLDAGPSHRRQTLDLSAWRISLFYLLLACFGW